jgi:hypoxanthine phosphoribosyltransferase
METTDHEVGEILVDEETLQRRVRELAAQVSVDYAGRSPLIVGVLKGAIFFIADLVREMSIDCELDFMAVSSYGTATTSSGVVRILKDLDTPLAGRHVLLVEDIIDSGLTLSYLHRNLISREPATLEICALTAKPAGMDFRPAPKYIGFPIPDAFVVGYGLDYAQRHRGLPHIALLRQP